MKYLLLIISVIGFSKLGISQEDSKVIVEGYQKLSPNEAVRCIFIDKENFKWLGTDRGLYRMINLENDPELIVTDSITAITEDKKQLLWYGNRNLLLSSEDLSQKYF